MLPGFRFLFATVVLAVSVLVFGLGAAALLRAAHEEFASLPSWRLAQQPLLAPQFEMNAPTLAMMRIEAPAPKSIVEMTRPQAPYMNVVIPDAPRPRTPRQEALRLDAPRDVPEIKPVEAAAVPADAAPGDSNKTGQVETPPPPIAPAAETVASLNAQASTQSSVYAPASVEAPGEQPAPEVRPAETHTTETNGIESLEPETRQPDARPSAATASETEASEAPATESISSTVRSSKATAADTLPGSVVKKATRPSARSIARRRLAIARARAARERTRVLQQQGHNPDPFTQILGGPNARPG